MLVLGDIACPTAELSKSFSSIFQENGEIFGTSSIIANLEGVITSSSQLDANTPILSNHPNVLNTLKSCSKEVVLCLANNHTLDLAPAYSDATSQMDVEGVNHIGAGLSKSKSIQPVVLNDQGRTLVVFNACWNFLLYHQSNPESGVHVAEIDEKWMSKEIAAYRRKYQDAKILVYLHWNFDLEVLPFPSHRTFARELIDAGANFVIGTHSHCVQGGEQYRDGYIVYGLGNFFLPNSVFSNGRLSFPDFSRTELVFEYDFENEKAVCHWFKYVDTNADHRLEHLTSEEFKSSAKLREYTPYAGMDPLSYLRFFRKNRRKKILIPIFKNHRSYRMNGLSNWYLRRRAVIARTLAKLDLIKWQN